MIWRGVRLMAAGEISTGELVTFIMYSIFIGASIGGIPEVVNRMQALLRVRAGPLIAATRIPQVRDLMARLRADDALPERLLDCGDLHLVRSLVVAGLGVAFLPRRVAMDGPPGSLRRLHPSLPGFPDTIFLLYRADMHRTRAALRLKDALVAHGKRLRGADPNEDSILPP